MAEENEGVFGKLQQNKQTKNLTQSVWFTGSAFSAFSLPVGERE